MRSSGHIRPLFDLLTGALHRWRLNARPQRLQLDGPHEPVEVVTDGWGVPHIRAENLEDLFFAQGYVTARDRLFQIDYNRHGARGRLSELVGRKTVPWKRVTVQLKERSTVDVDLMLRTFGLESMSERSLELYSEEARAVTRAYTAGVNAYLARTPWSLEHRLIQRRSRPWRESDCVVLSKAIGFELNYAWRHILFGALVQASKIPEDLQRVLWPEFPQEGSTIVGAQAYATTARELLATREAAEVALGLGNAPGMGSNAWVVSGKLSRDGMPWLANDTHLKMTAPSPWHEVALHCPELSMRGFALAGVPGVSIGQTPEVAWGITAGLVHDLDIFVERLHREDPTQYLTPQGWQPLERRQEVFHVRGEGVHSEEIFSSRHGPILRSTATEAPAGHAFALRWTAHKPAREIDTLLKLWRAKNVREAREAFAEHVCPSFSVTCADSEGHIAYFHAGDIPRRKEHSPLRPLEGWNDRWAWEGIVPYDSHPREFDPDCGYIVTANNRIGPWDLPFEVGGIFEPPYRFDRISRALDLERGDFVAEDFVALQLDVHAPWAGKARKLLLEVVGGMGGLAVQPQSLGWVAAKHFEAWDAEARVDSAGAAIVYTTLGAVASGILRRLVGEEGSLAFLEAGSSIGPVVLRLLSLGERLSEQGIDLRSLIRAGFAQAVQHCREHMGADPEAWEWGRLHTLVCAHAFEGTALGHFFSLGPEAFPGGPDTVNRGDMNFGNGCAVTVGAAMRFLASVGDPRRSQSVLPGGQSGDRFNPHYDDQMPLFLDGALKPSGLGVVPEVLESKEWLIPAER